MNKLQRDLAISVFKNFDNLKEKEWDNNIPVNIFPGDFNDIGSFQTRLYSNEKVNNYIIIGEFEKKQYDEDNMINYEIDYYLSLYIKDNKNDKATMHLFLDSYTYNSILLEEGKDILGYTIPDILDYIKQKVLLDDIDINDLFK